MAHLSETRVTVRGVSGPVLTGGMADSDEAIVFVHGNPGSGRDWGELASQAAEFSRVIAPDMPGFGQADKPANFDYTVEGYATHLHGLIQNLGVRKVHLVLHDFGGPWGLGWATLAPQALRSITLINTGVLLNYRWHYMARIWRTPVIGELSMILQTRSAFGLALSHGNPRGLPTAFVDGMYRDLDAGTKRAVLRLYRATNDPGRMSEQLAVELRQLDLPAFVLWGEQDPYIPVRYADVQRQIFPRAQVVKLPDSGHWPFADNPQATAQAVLPFLRSQVSQPAGGLQANG